MKDNTPKNMAASVRDRLYNLAQHDNRDFNLVLTAFATERLLYRLSCSEYADRFVLKGARLFSLWSHRPHRPTRDLDLLGYGDSSADALREAFQAICRTEVEPDGLTIDEDTMTIEEIRLEQEYEGQRIKLVVRLGQARIPLQIDVGFGDVVTPEVQMMEYAPLLDTLPAPRIRAYTRESVIAEKFQAMVALGALNTRMKDFYDICALAGEFDYDGQTLCDAIQATFRRRKTPVPAELPLCLQPAFGKDEDRQHLWKAFLTRSASQDISTDDFATALGKIRDFLGPPMLAASREKAVFHSSWLAGKGWQAKETAD